MTARPVRIPPHRVAPERRKIVEDEILKMEKDGTIRFCVEYSKLNGVTTKTHTNYQESMISQMSFEEQNTSVVLTSLVATGRLK